MVLDDARPAGHEALALKLHQASLDLLPPHRLALCSMLQ